MSLGMKSMSMRMRSSKRSSRMLRGRWNMRWNTKLRL